MSKIDDYRKNDFSSVQHPLTIIILGCFIFLVYLKARIDHISTLWHKCRLQINEAQILLIYIMWRTPHMGYCEPAQTKTFMNYVLTQCPQDSVDMWGVTVSSVGENNLQSEPCGFRARAKQRRVGVDGGGRWGHTGWQQNRSCLRASHLLPSAHRFCPFYKIRLKSFSMKDTSEMKKNISAVL